MKKEDDDDDDPFADDDEEDAETERLKAERVAAYNAKKANKPKTVAKVRDSSHPSDTTRADLAACSLL